MLEISVLMAQFPSKQIAQLSFEYRTLGLGYANIGGLLMSSGIPYDSESGRALCAALSAIMTGVSYATSAEMAARLGAFPGYKKNREHMLRVVRNHRRAAYGERTGYEKVATPPVPLDHKALEQISAHSRASGNPEAATLAPRFRGDERSGFGKLGEHAKRAWDARARARRGARLSQRAGDRDRADRHHRPRDGLRHHRHRAGFRAGEIQEARRRRLFQDHQPRRARGVAHARLSRERDRRDRGLCRRPRQSRERARHQPYEPQGQGLHRRGDRHDREGAADAPSTSNSCSTNGR